MRGQAVLDAPAPRLARRIAEKARGDLARVLAGHGMQTGLTAVAALAIAAILPKEELGLVRTVSAYFLIALVPAHVCMHDAVPSYIARGGDPRLGRRYAGQGVLVVLVASLLITALSLILIETTGMFEGGDRWVARLGAAALAPTAIATLGSGCLRGTGDLRAFSRLAAATGIVPFIAIVGGVLLAGAMGWSLGKLASAAALALLAWSLARGAFVWERPDAGLLRSLLIFGSIQVLSGVASMALGGADIIALERWTRDRALVADYAVAALASRLGGFVPNAIGARYFAEVGAASGDPVRLGPLLARIMRLGAAASVLMACAAFLAGPWALDIVFRGKYAESGAILRALAPFIVFASFAGVISPIQIALGKPRAEVAMSLAGLASVAALLPVAIPAYGAVGAAFAMGLAHAIGVAVGLVAIGWHLRRIRAGMTRDPFIPRTDWRIRNDGGIGER